jgi:hypothetical protein
VLAALASAATGAGSASGVGQYATVASGAAAANYSVAYVDGVLTVTPAMLTATAGSASRLYGSANPALFAGYTGFVNGETAAVLTAPASVATSAASTSGVGQYATRAAGATASNYSFTYVDGVLTVDPAALTARANNVERVYGSGMPSLGVSYSGFVNGETEAVLGARAVATSSGVNVGTYAITAAGAQAANYVVAYVNGALTIRPAPLSITANDAGRLPGKANPAFSATYAGFQYGDTAASALSTPVALATAATIDSAIGQYTIVASGASAANYTISHHDGVLVVALAAPLPFQEGMPSAMASVFAVPETAPRAGAALAPAVPGTPGALAGLNVVVRDGGLATADGEECADLRACLRSR